MNDNDREERDSLPCSISFSALISGRKQDNHSCPAYIIRHVYDNLLPVCRFSAKLLKMPPSMAVSVLFFAHLSFWD